jgi:hypothetical protein
MVSLVFDHISTHQAPYDKRFFFIQVQIWFNRPVRSATVHSLRRVTPFEPFTLFDCACRGHVRRERNSVDDVAMTGAVAPMVLVGAAVGWRRLCTMGSVGRCVGDAVDAVACRVPASGRGWPECAQGKTAAVLWLPFSYTVRDEMEKKTGQKKENLAGGRVRKERGRRQCCGLVVLLLLPRWR